jgi:hypothetical protein
VAAGELHVAQRDAGVECGHYEGGAQRMRMYLSDSGASAEGASTKFRSCRPPPPAPRTSDTRSSASPARDGLTAAA